MTSISAHAVGGDQTASAASNNPIKSDGELQVLMQKLDSIKKYKSFHRWKDNFLSRFEQFLYQKGIKPAEESARRLQDSLERLVTKTQRVLDYINQGQLSDTKKSVKASLALQEMCNDLEKIRGNMASDVIPSFKSDEQVMGYSKFHLGAVLIRQGFEQYSVMKAVEEAVTEIDAKLVNVADRQQHDLFGQYNTQVQRFCDVMADLNLYDIMLKCVHFRNPPGDDESEEPESIQLILHLTPDGTRISIEVEETVAMPEVKATAQIAFRLGNRPIVIQHRGKMFLDGDDDTTAGKTLEQLGFEDGTILDVEILLIPIVINNTWDGTQITLSVEPQLYVTDLKRLLENESSIPAMNQNLTFNDESLNDVTKTLGDYQIVKGSILDLEPKRITISVETPDGATHSLMVGPSDDVCAIKQEIEDSGGMVVSRQVLKDANGMVLPDDGSTVKALGIRDGTTLLLDVFKIPIMTNCWNGDQYESLVDPTEPLFVLKKQLEKESKILANNQNLSVNGETLNNDAQPIQDFGIKAGSVLNLEPNLVSLVVTTPDGVVHEIHVSPSDDCNSIKQRVEEASGMIVNRQVLMDSDGKEIVDDGSTVRDMGLRDGDLLVANVFKVPVAVNTWDGKQYDTNVDPTDALNVFKQELEALAGIPAGNQTLMLHDKILDQDGCTLQDCGVHGGSVLYLEPKTISISVETPDGATHSILLTLSDHPGAIKEKIQIESGISVPRQVLMYADGKEVSDDASTLKDLRIRDGDTLVVDIFKIPVNVRCWDGQESEILVDPTETLQELKQKLQLVTAIPANNQKLCLDGSDELRGDDTKTIQELGVKAKSVLDVAPENINVVVTTPCGDTVEISISTSDNGDAIKQKIEKVTGISVVRQVLRNANGCEFPLDGSTVRDLGLREGYKLLVEIYKIPILAQSWDGKEYEMMVDPTKPLLEVKKMMEELTGIPVDNQYVQCHEKELMDNTETVQDCGIQAGSILKVEPLAINLVVTTPDAVEHRIQVSPRDDDSAIKRKIEDVSRIIVSRQTLSFKDGEEVPSDGTTVANMGMKDGFELTVSIFKISITIKDWDNNVFEVMIDPTEELQSLKEELEVAKGLSAANQNLQFDGTPLDDNSKVIQDYGVQQGSILDLEPWSITVSVQTPEGNILEIEISPSDDTSSIKQKIQEESGVVVARQVLQDSAGNELADGSSVKEMGIRNGDALHVDIFNIPIRIKNWDGSHQDLMVDPTESLSDLREKISSHFGIAPDNQNIVLGDNTLDDDTRSLKDCGLEPGTVLDLAPKSIKVTMTGPDGTDYRIDLSLVDDTEAMKKKFEEASGMAVPRQVLKSGDGAELPSDGSTVRDMAIREGTTLSVDIFKIPVTVKSWDDRQFDILIEPTKELSVFKKQLEEDSGIAAENQNLSLAGDSLSDDTKALRDYSVVGGSVFDLEPKTVTVSVITPDGQSHALCLSMSDGVKGIKQKIQDTTEIAVPRQVLKRADDDSDIPDDDDGFTVKTLGIRDGDKLKIEIFKIPISVQGWDGSQYEVKVDPTSDLASLKTFLADESGISEQNQTISLDSTPLHDDTTSLQEHGVKSGSVLELEPKTIMVTIETPDGLQHEIKIAPDDNCDQIKQKIQDSTGMLVCRQVLKDKDGNVLPTDGSNVKQMGLRDSDVVCVDIFKIGVTVHSWDGNQYAMAVDPTESLIDLKEQLAVESAIPVTNQVICFQDAQLLDDSKTHHDHGIEEGSTMYLEPHVVKLIVVTTQDGVHHEISVSPSDDSNEIKKKVSEVTGIAIPRQVLKHQHDGKELPTNDDDEGCTTTVKSMGLRDGDGLTLDIFMIPVVANSWDGKQYELSVDPSISLAELKHQLENETDIAAENQNLSLGNEPLVEDATSLNDCGIQAGSILDIEPKQIKISVRPPEGGPLEIDVSLSGNGKAIRQEIEHVTGISIPRQVVLWKDGSEILPNDDTTAKDMGLRQGDELVVEIFKIPVTVQCWDGTQYEMFVDPTETLASFRQKVEEESGIPANNQSLYLDDEILRNNVDTTSLEDNGIQPESVLNLEPLTIKVAITTPDGITHEVELSPSDDSEVIKQKIEDKTEMAVSRQVLRLDGNAVSSTPGTTVRTMGIREGSALSVEIFKVPITIHTKDGRVFKLLLDPTIAIGDIKRYLDGKAGIPIRYQILLFGETQLVDDDRTAGSYGIVIGSILHVDKLDDPIVFVDVKCGTLFGRSRDVVVEGGILTPKSEYGPGLYEYTEAVRNQAEKDSLLSAMLGSPNLGVKAQIVVEKMEVEDYDVAGAEDVKSKWGVQLKKTQKNKRGSEFIFVDIKTDNVGLLDRSAMVERGFIHPIGVGKGETLLEGEKDAQCYDRYVKEIRRIFRVASL